MQNCQVIYQTFLLATSKIKHKLKRYMRESKNEAPLNKRRVPRNSFSSSHSYSARKGKYFVKT